MHYGTGTFYDNYLLPVAYQLLNRNLPHNHLVSRLDFHVTLACTAKNHFLGIPIGPSLYIAVGSRILWWSFRPRTYHDKRHKRPYLAVPQGPLWQMGASLVHDIHWCDIPRRKVLLTLIEKLSAVSSIVVVKASKPLGGITWSSSRVTGGT